MTKKKGSRAWLGTLIAGIAAFLIVVGIYGLWWNHVLSLGGTENNYTSPGTFGDSFGVVNALFSGLALAAIAISLWQAQRQIAIQQIELTQNTEEMRTQNKFLVKQSVQNQFFQLLDSWQEVLGQYRMTRGNIEIQGRDVLAQYSESLVSSLRVAVTANDNRSELEDRRNIINTVYDKRIAGAKGVHLGHYFRLLYNIIRFVDASEHLAYDEKQGFARILRAHLSEPEFTLLYYNCIHTDGEKMHPFVEQYDLLQNMSEESVVMTIDLDFYPITKKRWDTEGKRVTNTV